MRETRVRKGEPIRLSTGRSHRVIVQGQPAALRLVDSVSGAPLAEIAYRVAGSALEGRSDAEGWIRRPDLPADAAARLEILPAIWELPEVGDAIAEPPLPDREVLVPAPAPLPAVEDLPAVLGCSLRCSPALAGPGETVAITVEVAGRGSVQQLRLHDEEGAVLAVVPVREGAARWQVPDTGDDCAPRLVSFDYDAGDGWQPADSLQGFCAYLEESR